MTLRKQSLSKLATLPPPRASYRDANGYVFLDVLVSEAEPGWVELTPEQRDAVRPLSETDRRTRDAWHAAKEPA